MGNTLENTIQIYIVESKAQPNNYLKPCENQNWAPKNQNKRKYYKYKLTHLPDHSHLPYKKWGNVVLINSTKELLKNRKYLKS